MDSTPGSVKLNASSGLSTFGCGSWNGRLIHGGGSSMDDPILGWLLIVVGALSVILSLVSMATLGRKMADLEYQIAAGLNGVRRIQSWINARTHANRVFLGITFLTTSVLSISDLPLYWRTWVGRVLFILVLLAYTISSVLDWIDERAQVKLLLREDELQKRHGVQP
jgi:hypothetical protein